MTQMTEAPFKELALPSPDIPSVRARKIANEFNQRFGEDEIRLHCNGNGIVVRLWRLDMNQFGEVVRDLALRHKLPEDNFLAEMQSTIAKIGSYAVRGGRREFAGFNRERKVQDRAGKEKKRGKLADARVAGFSRENCELPPEFQDKIICADSTEFLRQLPDNCVDLIFTSPPYNFGLDYAGDKSGDSANNGAADDHHWREYFARLFAVLEECIRVAKFGGRIVVNVQPLFSDYVPSHHVISNFFQQRGLVWKGEILWEKNNYNCKYTSWGSWKSPSSPYLKYSWEFVEVFCKGDIKKAGRSADADITADEFKKWVYGKWSIAPERKMLDRFGHPAMFPEELARRVLRLFSFRGDVILDPFNGAGTTTLVAKKNGRRFMGVDISPEYCATAEQRLDEVLL